MFIHKQFHLLSWQLESFFHSTGLEQVVVFTDQHMSVCVTRDIHQDLEISAVVGKNVMYMYVYSIYQSLDHVHLKGFLFHSTNTKQVQIYIYNMYKLNGQWKKSIMFISREKIPCMSGACSQFSLLLNELQGDAPYCKRGLLKVCHLSWIATWRMGFLQCTTLKCPLICSSDSMIHQYM